MDKIEVNVRCSMWWCCVALIKEKNVCMIYSWNRLVETTYHHKKEMVRWPIWKGIWCRCVNQSFIFIDYRLLLRLWDDTHNTHTLIFCTVVPIYFLCIHSHPLFQAEQQEWHSSTQTSQSQTQKSTSHLSRRVATKGEKVRCAPCVACGRDQLPRFSWIKT